MATLDDDLAKAVTEGFRQAQIDIVNQDLILSGTGDVTVTLADGSKKTGPSWSKLSAQAMAAGASAAAAKTSETNAKTSETNANSSKTAAASSASAAKTSETNAKTSETNAKTSETNAKTSETNAANSASSAAASLAAAQLLTSVPYEAAPFPDVWLPLNDDLRLNAGFAPFDKQIISGQVLELATKSGTFTRSTIATYIDKSGVLQTADINEPRFEREGLLIEGSSSNYILNSEDPTKWAGTSTAVTKTKLAADGTSQAVTMKGVINTNSSIPFFVTSNVVALAVGDKLTLSCRAKGSYGYIRISFALDGSTSFATLIDAKTGIALNPPAGMTIDSTPGSDGYATITATMTAVNAGNYAGTIAAQRLNEDTTIPLNAEYYVQMPQCEKNAVATSYIPTGASAVTRASDKLSLQSSGNIGYQAVGDLFNRTLAFEIAVNRYITPGNGYADLIRVGGSNNDIIFRAVSSTINSYIGGSGPSVAITYPFSSKVYVQSVDVNNTNSMYFDGKTSNRTMAPTNPASKPTSIDIQSHQNVVYHIRNFRIWHRLLTPNQINGLR